MSLVGRFVRFKGSLSAVKVRDVRRFKEDLPLNAVFRIEAEWGNMFDLSWERIRGGGSMLIHVPHTYVDILSKEDLEEARSKHGEA